MAFLDEFRIGKKCHRVIVTISDNQCIRIFLTRLYRVTMHNELPGGSRVSGDPGQILISYEAQMSGDLK